MLLAFHLVRLNKTVSKAKPIEPTHRRLKEKTRIRAYKSHRGTKREREREGAPACCSALVGALKCHRCILSHAPMSYLDGSEGIASRRVPLEFLEPFPRARLDSTSNYLAIKLETHETR